LLYDVFIVQPLLSGTATSHPRRARAAQSHLRAFRLFPGMPTQISKLLLFLAVPACVTGARSEEERALRSPSACQDALDPILRDGRAASEELIQICRKHYSEGVCNMARTNLEALPPVDSAEAAAGPRKASAQEACAAVQDAWNFHKAILLRQSTRGRQPSSGSNETKASNATKAAAAANATEESAPVMFDKLDVSIAPKWYPVPHNRFAWEKNVTSTLTDIDKMVYKDEADGVNVSDPRLIERADAFEPYIRLSKAGKSNATSTTATSSNATNATKEKESFMQVGAEADAQSPRSMHKFGEALRKAVSQSLQKHLRTRHKAARAHTPRLRRGAAFLKGNHAARAAHSQVAA